MGKMTTSTVKNELTYVIKKCKCRKFSELISVQDLWYCRNARNCYSLAQLMSTVNDGNNKAIFYIYLGYNAHLSSLSLFCSTVMSNSNNHFLKCMSTSLQQDKITNGLRKKALSALSGVKWSSLWKINLFIKRLYEWDLALNAPFCLCLCCCLNLSS